MRKIDVYKTPAVVRAGETFEWENKSSNGTVTVSSTNWPLTQPSYPVSNSPAQASVNAQAQGGTSFPFQSSPPPSPPETQTMVVAGWHGSLCNDVVVSHNQYVLWHNDNNQTATIAPQQGTSWFWPETSLTVDAGDDLIKHVPTTAQAKSYPIIITLKDGSSPCPQAANPKIIVNTGPMPKPKL